LDENIDPISPKKNAILEIGFCKRSIRDTRKSFVCPGDLKLNNWKKLGKMYAKKIARMLQIRPFNEFLFLSINSVIETSRW
jgi:hypothetical protein